MQMIPIGRLSSEVQYQVSFGLIVAVRALVLTKHILFGIKYGYRYVMIKHRSI